MPSSTLKGDLANRAAPLRPRLCTQAGGLCGAQVPWRPIASPALIPRSCWASTRAPTPCSRCSRMPAPAGAPHWSPRQAPPTSIAYSPRPGSSDLLGSLRCAPRPLPPALLHPQPRACGLWLSGAAAWRTRGEGPNALPQVRAGGLGQVAHGGSRLRSITTTPHGGSGYSTGYTTPLPSSRHALPGSGSGGTQQWHIPAGLSRLDVTPLGLVRGCLPSECPFPSLSGKLFHGHSMHTT